MKKVKDAIFMASWKLTRLLGISTLLQGKASSSQMFMFMICFHSKRIASM
jgi:hypothetical protein